MGFRDIKKFNLAMLGKQGWWFMTNPTSVCQGAERKVLSSNDFTTAHKKKNASHTWRATLAERVVLELGLIRRIGDGTSTNIWNDKWIPNATGFKLICRQEGATTIRVCDMLNQAGSWDDRALAETLIPTSWKDLLYY
jgi:hypothetical protein